MIDRYFGHGSGWSVIFFHQVMKIQYQDDRSLES